MNKGAPPVVSMMPHHISSVVKIHLDSFPGFFLSFLGPRFLSHYYKGICAAPEGLNFVYLNAEGTPIGFVAGASNPRGFYSRLLKRDWLNFFLASIGTILRQPSAVKRIARGLFHPSVNPSGNDVAGLFSIAILPSLQGIGAGKRLVQFFLREAGNRGCKRVFLTTDGNNNETVNAFYVKLGFRIERQYVTPEGRHMNEYWINLPGDIPHLPDM